MFMGRDVSGNDFHGNVELKLSANTVHIILEPVSDPTIDFDEPDMRVLSGVCCSIGNFAVEIPVDLEGVHDSHGEFHPIGPQNRFVVKCEHATVLCYRSGTLSDDEIEHCFSVRGEN
jgi:hypothetical protein